MTDDRRLPPRTLRSWRICCASSAAWSWNQARNISSNPGSRRWRRSTSSQSIDQLIERLRGSGVNGLVTEVVEAMVTTETSFFRDIHPFETLEDASCRS